MDYPVDPLTSRVCQDILTMRPFQLQTPLILVFFIILIILILIYSGRSIDRSSSTLTPYSQLGLILLALTVFSSLSTFHHQLVSQRHTTSTLTLLPQHDILPCLLV